MVIHYNKVFEGYLTQFIAPLPRHYLSKIPVADHGERRRLPPGRDRQAAGLRARSSTSRSPRRRSSASPRTTSTRTPAPASRPTSTQLVFKWYGDPDADDRGLPEQTRSTSRSTSRTRTSRRSRISATRSRRSRPSCTSSCGRTGRRARSQTEGTEQEHRWLLAQPGGPGPRHGLPDGRPGDPPGHRLRDRQERDQHAPPRRQRRGREHEHQPVGVVLQGHRPGRPSTRTRPSRSSRMAAGPTPTATASSRRTA